ncbi:helix-turn-helix domain-containing protein [Promicromonospora sp. NPDC090134]|uniref:helix-turn-helix domain-containing protein n=1 Tax=Promicromonospora sp. NPDC090134 TaxID=3364408 RepID=UPI00382D8558
MADTAPPQPTAHDGAPEETGPPPPSTRTGREPLLRHMLGERLRHLRHVRGETLDQTARRAGISPQYLSEIERGVKEPSSEMIAAITGALDVTLVDLVSAVADRLVTVRDAWGQPTCQAAFALAA